MGRKINSIEREIDKIRLEIYEETKGMTHEQLNEYYHRSAEAAAKKYGFKLVSSANDVPRDADAVTDGE
ncbi:MAG: hypothetical protein FWH44_04195 [Methanomassiliicoccaceae archaeon]|nr:hypothetical protein [Methanomassiliicoccaceae archaeon]